MSSRDVTERILDDSYHVATLDNDAPRIFAESAEFIAKHTSVDDRGRGWLIAMRSNGLTAATYTPIADLNPQLADALLADLKQRGVAAYTKPVESSTAAGFDRPEYRHGVKDRLYVDTAASDEVRAVLAAHDPDLVDTNDDLAWEQIVAGFDRASGADVHPWPENENVAPDEDLVDERDLARPADASDSKPRLRWGSGRDGDDR